jgi:NADH:ubiquinone oxidoreductase subunit K
MHNLKIFLLLAFPVFMFFFGILGIFITRKNLILLLISIELMLLAASFSSGLFSYLLQDLMGEALILYILTLAGAEASIGLALLIIFYRIRGLITVNFVTSLKG